MSLGNQNATLKRQRQGKFVVLMALSVRKNPPLLPPPSNGLNKIARDAVLVRDGDTMVDIAECDESQIAS